MLDFKTLSAKQQDLTINGSEQRPQIQQSSHLLTATERELSAMAMTTLAMSHDFQNVLIGAAGAEKLKKNPCAPKRFKSAFIFYSTWKHKAIKEELKRNGIKKKVSHKRRCHKDMASRRA